MTVSAKLDNNSLLGAAALANQRLNAATKPADYRVPTPTSVQLGLGRNLRMLPAHTPGQTLVNTWNPTTLPRAATPAAKPAPVIRRPAGLTRRAPTLREIETPIPTVSFESGGEATSAPQATPDTGYIEQDGVKIPVPGSTANTDRISQASGPAFDAPPAQPPMTTYGDSTGVYQLGAGDPTPRDWGSAPFGDVVSARMNSALGLRRAQTRQADAAAFNHTATANIGLAKLPSDMAYQGALAREATQRADVGYWKAPGEIALTGAQIAKNAAETATENALREPRVGGLRAQTAKSLFDVEEGRALLPGKQSIQGATVRNLDSEVGLRNAQAAGTPDKMEIAKANNEAKIVAAGEAAYTKTMAATQNAELARQAQADAIEGARAAMDGGVYVPGVEGTKAKGSLWWKTPAMPAAKGLYAAKGITPADAKEYRDALQKAQELGDASKVAAVQQRFQEKFGRK